MMPDQAWLRIAMPGEGWFGSPHGLGFPQFTRIASGGCPPAPPFLLKDESPALTVELGPPEHHHWLDRRQVQVESGQCEAETSSGSSPLGRFFRLDLPLLLSGIASVPSSCVDFGTLGSLIEWAMPTQDISLIAM
ncbi:hypothetical protein BH23PLA1_BH23PLA1_15630 [soil metagenome]